MSWSLVSSHLWVRKKNKLPRLPQLRHNSRVGQSISSCPGLLRRHFPHHVGIEGVAANAAVTVALAVGALAWWSSAFRALFAAVFHTAALPATSASRLVMQLRHFERSSGSKTKGSVRR